MYIDEQPEIIQGVCQLDEHVVTGAFVRSKGTKPVLGPNCMMPYTDNWLDEMLHTRFKHLKTQNVGVICYNTIKWCLTTSMPNFKSQS